MSDPRATYTARLAARREALAVHERHDLRASNLRLVVAAGAVLLAWAAFGPAVVAPLALAVPVVAFLVLVVVHERVVRRRDRARRAVAFYERALSRLDGDWAGKGEDGARFRDDHHPYANDLDLFGTASLYERLCEARTRFGQDTLAAFLLVAASLDVARARQGAVRELATKLDLREEVALLGEESRRRAADAPTAGAGTLVAWATARQEFPRFVEPLAIALAAVGAAVVVGWAADLVPRAAALSVLLLEAALALSLRQRVRDVAAGVDAARAELALLAALLQRIEREPCTDAHLAALQARLRVDGAPPSVVVRRLQRLVDRWNAPANAFFAPFAAVLLWRTRAAFALERWRRAHGAAMTDRLAVVGEVEALLSLGGYSYEHPHDAYPQLVDGSAQFAATALGHPLLRDGGVRNDVALGADAQLLLVSGSNMSGKSTFLRAIGCAAVLAQAGAPVTARSATMTVLSVGATLRVHDSLAEGASRFYAEITRLKQVMDAARGGRPLLFLLDELLSGTNSRDRRVAAEPILRRLVDDGAIGLVTTHDLALADVASALAPRARNVHFADVIEGGKVRFDYALRDGVVERSNALELMRAVGLDV